jgi:cell filamentation protein
MAELERGPLRQFTPCRFDSADDVVKALAIVHTELMLIYPFREGNGRIGRLLAILMGLQAKLPPLDFSGIKGKKRQQCFVAVRADVGRDYEPMEKPPSNNSAKSPRTWEWSGVESEIRSCRDPQPD